MTKSTSRVVTMPSSTPPTAPVSVTHTLVKFLVSCSTRHTAEQVPTHSSANCGCGTAVALIELAGKGQLAD